METLYSYDWVSMRAWSKAIFRMEHRLPVALMARSAQPDELYAQAIADRLGLGHTEVTGHLKDFAKAGLLEISADRPPASKAGGRRGTLYVQADDEFWECLQALGERFRRPPITLRR